MPSDVALLMHAGYEKILQAKSLILLCCSDTEIVRNITLSYHPDYKGITGHVCLPASVAIACAAAGCREACSCCAFVP